ncbi:MAG: hypothetical protein ACLGI3_16840 [Actinomycetes bacterium]
MTAPTKAARTYSLGAVLPHVRQAAELIGNRFDVDTILGWRLSAKDPLGHPAGRAIDLMTYSDRAKGRAIVAYALANAEALGLQYAIFEQTYFVPGKAPSRMEDRGSPTQNHMDHPHLNFHVRGGSGAVSDAGAFAGASASGTTEAGAFDGWAGGLLGLGLKLGATAAALALAVNGVRKTVKS